jgi:hypothetical protein
MVCQSVFRSCFLAVLLLAVPAFASDPSLVRLATALTP